MFLNWFGEASQEEVTFEQKGFQVNMLKETRKYLRSSYFVMLGDLGEVTSSMGTLGAERARTVRRLHLSRYKLFTMDYAHTVCMKLPSLLSCPEVWTFLLSLRCLTDESTEAQFG